MVERWMEAGGGRDERSQIEEVLTPQGKDRRTGFILHDCYITTHKKDK